MAWSVCVLVVLLQAALLATGQETSTEAATSAASTEPPPPPPPKEPTPTRMSMPEGSATPPLVHQSADSTAAAPNDTTEAPGKGAAAVSHAAVLAVAGALLVVPFL